MTKRKQKTMVYISAKKNRRKLKTNGEKEGLRNVKRIRTKLLNSSASSQFIVLQTYPAIKFGVLCEGVIAEVERVEVFRQ